jgi:hypothetical protein
VTDDDLTRLAAAARDLPNRGACHIFLGSPLSDGGDKTVVEPGNTFSPGIATCGVSLWLAVDGEVFCPDMLPDDEVEWSFGGEDGLPPVVESRWAAGPVSVLHRLSHLGGEGGEGADFGIVTLSSREAIAADLALVVRDVGPAGGKIAGLEWREVDNALIVGGRVTLTVEQQVECKVLPADGEHDSPIAVLHTSATIGPDAPFHLSSRAEHGYSLTGFDPGVPRSRPFASVAPADGFRRCEREWSEALPARIFCPDAPLVRAWERSAFHILAAMECGLPRIGAVNYPVFWTRDGVIVLRALDLMGRHDLARTGCDYLAPLYFAGGFGAESDAPGEGIWALVCHARITGDDEWLARVFPHIDARTGWLRRMLNAEAPIRRASDSRTPPYVNTSGANIVCLAARNGLIHGRMDWHSPDFYINCWARAGFDRAGWAALHLGREILAEEWVEEAERLDEAIAEHLLPRYGNERDPVVSPYPTGALGPDRERLLERFASWFKANRLDGKGNRVPEKDWTYFEAAQIHNAFLLGMAEEAWISLDGMLEPVGAWDVSAYTEGPPGGNEHLPFRNDVGLRGWLHPERALAGNMPHNWTSAEMINLIRDMFVVEEDGRLLLGLGVPGSWLRPGASFGVRTMPTDLGSVSYTVTVGGDGAMDLQYDGPPDYQVRWAEA